MELPKSAGTITFNIKTRQVLMIKVQSPGTKQIYWTFPKGEIEPGEDPKKTAIRETLEETGITPQIIRKVEDIEIYRQFRGTKFHKRVILYVAYTTDMYPKPDYNEVLDAKFVDFDKALIAIKKHDNDYLPGLLKALTIVANKFPQLYEIG